MFFHIRPLILTSEARKDLKRSFVTAFLRMSPSMRKILRGLNLWNSRDFVRSNRRRSPPDELF